jgi:hypothetical protein
MEIIMLQKIWDWCKRSETIVVARILSAGGAVLAAVASYGDIFLTPSVTGVLPSKWLGVYTAVIGVVVEIARRRNGSTDPVK